MVTAHSIALYRDFNRQLSQLTARYGVSIHHVEDGSSIPGSYWGDSEAGLIGPTLYVRNDTPIHSALHEACHYVCMDETRRRQLDTDAAGDFEEENGVCYLQILLAGYLDNYDRAAMFHDMDAWGYSFRLGSSKAWFEQDADDAREWLQTHGLIDQNATPTWRLRR